MMIKKILFGLLCLGATFSVTSCTNDDDYYIDQNYYANNRGEVSYDGVTKTIRYMNIVDTGEVLNDGSKVYSIDLSTEYLNGNNSTVHTDALFQADVIVPRGQTISGTFDMLDSDFRTFDFAWYYEGVTIQNNTVVSAEFQIQNDNFIRGTLALKTYTNGYAEVDIHAVDLYNGVEVPLTLWFRGNVN